MSQIDELIRQLPDDLKVEVEDFVRLLLKTRAHKPRGELKLSWRGALRDERGQHTSVELQHQLRESWGK